MTSDAVLITIDLGEVDAALQDILDRGEDLTDVMALVAEDLVAAVSDRYDTEGDGDWEPHAPSTLRRRGGRAAKLLQDTGVLAASTVPDWGVDFAEASTSVAYVFFHLEGGERLPKRNPFELRERVFDDVARIILDHIVDG